MSSENNYFFELVSELKAFALDHQKLLLSGFVGVSVLAAGGAFAVANLPAEPQITVQQITEAVPTTIVSPETLIDNKLNLNLYNSTELQAYDTVNSVLKRLAVQDTFAADFLRSDSFSQMAFKSPGRIIKSETNGLGVLQKLEIKWVEGQDSHYQRLVVLKTNNGWQSEIQKLPLQVDVRYRATTINSTLFSATDDAQIPDSVAVQLTEIFSGDIDFQRSLRKGDRFAVIYQVFMADGDLMRSGRVIAASLDMGGSTLQIQPFASSKTGGLWDEIRADLYRQLVEQSGDVQEIDGPLGREIIAKVPVVVPGEGAVVQPARFIGVDGPRWFLRGVIAGPAATDDALGRELVDVFRGLVVVRGNSPLPPRELLPLRVPAQASGS